MKHEEAVETMAAERYVLGELHDRQLEQFEEHFFSCPECAEDVRDLAALAAGAKELLSRPRKAETPKRRAAAPSTAWRWPWLRLSPSFAWCGALAVVALFSVYQTAQLQVAMRPQTWPAIVLTPEVRGDAPPNPVEKTSPFLPPLEFDLPGSSGKLQWNLRRADSEKVIYQETADAPQPGRPFQVLLPSSKLALGEYQLTVRSATVPSAKPWFFQFKLIASGR